MKQGIGCFLEWPFRLPVFPLTAILAGICDMSSIQNTYNLVITPNISYTVVFYNDRFGRYTRERQLSHIPDKMAVIQDTII